MFSCLFLVYTFTLTHEYQSKLKLDELTRDILSPKAVTRLEIRDRLLRARQDYRIICDKMREIIAADKSPDSYGTPRQIAVFVISFHVDYQSDAATVQSLIDNVHIRLPDNINETGITSPLEIYPALRGLLMTGEKAALPIVEKIKNSDDRTVHHVLSYWFKMHYGQRMAQCYLRNIIDENPNMPPEQRQRIDYVMGQISKNSR